MLKLNGRLAIMIAGLLLVAMVAGTGISGGTALAGETLSLSPAGDQPDPQGSDHGNGNADDKSDKDNQGNGNDNPGNGNQGNGNDDPGNGDQGNGNDDPGNGNNGNGNQGTPEPLPSASPTPDPTSGEGDPSSGGAHEEVELCHVTGNTNSPYILITVDANSAQYEGHIGHGDYEANSGDCTPESTVEEPTEEPTDQPTVVVTPVPTEEPAQEPTVVATQEPTNGDSSANGGDRRKSGRRPE